MGSFACPPSYLLHLAGGLLPETDPEDPAALEASCEGGRR